MPWERIYFETVDFPRACYLDVLDCLGDPFRSRILRIHENQAQRKPRGGNADGAAAESNTAWHGRSTRWVNDGQIIPQYQEKTLWKKYRVDMGLGSGPKKEKTLGLGRKGIVQTSNKFTIWLFDISMENGPFIDDVPIKTTIYRGFSMAMLNNQWYQYHHWEVCGELGGWWSTGWFDEFAWEKGPWKAYCGRTCVEVLRSFATFNSVITYMDWEQHLEPFIDLNIST